MKPTARRRPKGERMEGSQRRSRPARRETLVRPRMNIPWAYGPVGQIKAGEPLRWEWSVRAHRVGSASNGQELGLPILCVWMDINPTRRGPVAQRFERSAHNRKDGGSNPSGPNTLGRLGRVQSGPQLPNLSGGARLPCLMADTARPGPPLSAQQRLPAWCPGTRTPSRAVGPAEGSVTPTPRPEGGGVTTSRPC